ncbi:hypothetical protein Tco_1345615 [Tanacetum coccineum]
MEGRKMTFLIDQAMQGAHGTRDRQGNVGFKLIVTLNRKLRGGLKYGLPRGYTFLSVIKEILGPDLIPFGLRHCTDEFSKGCVLKEAKKGLEGSAEYYI